MALDSSTFLPSSLMGTGSPLTRRLNIPVFFLPNLRGSLSEDQLNMALRMGYLPLMPSSPSAVRSP